MKLSNGIYQKIKDDIFDFRMAPGQRFSENDIAREMDVSRTPVREALMALRREGYLEVVARSGWRVSPLDFERLEEFYELRILLEVNAIARLCSKPDNHHIDNMKQTWCVPPDRRETNWRKAAELDKQFHHALMVGGGNREMTRTHDYVMEHINIIRRIDFTQDERINVAYGEHERIITAVALGDKDRAQLMLRQHIESSKTQAQAITIKMLETAKRRFQEAYDTDLD